MYCYKHGAGPNVCMGIYYRVTEGQPNKVGCFSASVTSRDETIDCIYKGWNPYEDYNKHIWWCSYGIWRELDQSGMTPGRMFNKLIIHNNSFWCVRDEIPNCALCKLDTHTHTLRGKKFNSMWLTPGLKATTWTVSHPSPTHDNGVITV